MPIRRAVVPLLLSALVACAEPEDGDDLLTWEGSWQAAELLFLDEATDVAYEAIHELRPEYSVEELRGLFVATADVDYSTLEVAPDTLTFVDGSATRCAGRYHDLRDTLPTSTPTGPESFQDFELIEELEGDCSDYEAVSITALLPEGDEAHFHIITGDEAGPLLPPPWNPSVWTTTTTPAFFAEMLEAAAPGIASALPER